METIINFESRDIYIVYQTGHGKRCKFLGYYYDAGCSVDIDESKTWRYLEVSSGESGIEDFKQVDSDEYLPLLKQWISDLTPEEAEQEFITYNDGQPPVELSRELLTEDTPCGVYID